MVERRSVLLWGIAGALSFWACARLGIRATPIDAALPWIALIVTAVAWLGESPAVQCAVPLLIACAICFPDEQTRLLGYGAITAIAFCGAVLNVDELTTPRAIGFAVAGTALIRWIARTNFQFIREAIVLAGVIAIVCAVIPSVRTSRRDDGDGHDIVVTPSGSEGSGGWGGATGPRPPRFLAHARNDRLRLGIALALLAALYTPAIPFRTLVIPMLFIAVAALLRVRVTALPLVVIALVLTLFPYSGILARTPRYLKYGKPATNRVNLYWAMKPGQSKEFEVPQDARALILSLSNGANLKRRTVVGQVGEREIHVGDVVDWGFARRAEWWRSTNRLPRHAAGLIRGYGYDGWVDGAVRVEIPRDAKTIRVSVDPHLPPKTILQVEAFER